MSKCGCTLIYSLFIMLLVGSPNSMKESLSFLSYHKKLHPGSQQGFLIITMHSLNTHYTNNSQNVTLTSILRLYRISHSQFKLFYSKDSFRVGYSVTGID